MRRLAVVALLLAAGPAAGEGRIIGPDAFEALSLGRTWHYSLEGQAFGTERYLPDRRTLWRFEGGACVAGRWEAEGDAVCFRYEGQPGRSCWRLREGPGGFTADLLEQGVETGFRLRLEGEDARGMPCPGEELTS